jgi:hypothetical protein
MLIIEIILTIFVWRKGWRWWSLLPAALGLLIGFIIGYGIGVAGGDITAATGTSLLIDVGVIIALIIMLVNGPKPKEKRNDDYMYDKNF